MGKQGFFLKDNVFIEVGEFTGTTREDAVLSHTKSYSEINIDDHTPTGIGNHWKYTIVPLLEPQDDCITDDSNYARTCFFYATYFISNKPYRQIAGISRFRAQNTMLETYNNVRQSVIDDFWGSWGRSGAIFDETRGGEGLKMKSICFAVNNESGIMWCFYKDDNDIWHTSDVPSSSPTLIYKPLDREDNCTSGSWIFRDSSKDTNYGFITDYIPLQGGGISTIGGGDGAFDLSSDDVGEVDIINLPSALDTGFITMYAPNKSQLNDLASYMWSTNFIELITKLFQDPMECIISLKSLPVPVPTTGDKIVVLGNVLTSVTMPKITAQFIKYDCGNISIKKYWGSALDYGGYTKAQIFLPFIGGAPLDVDKIMGSTLNLYYTFDILTGVCYAQLTATRVEVSDDHTERTVKTIVGNWEGNASLDLPISASNFAGIVRGIGSALSTGAMLSVAPTAGAFAGMTTMGLKLSGAASVVNGMKPDISISGSITGNAGYIGCRTPFIQLTRPRQCLAETYNSMEGYPSNVSTKMSNLSGYTVISSVHLDNVGATSEELDEIEELLKEGVIF